MTQNLPSLGSWMRMLKQESVTLYLRGSEAWYREALCVSRVFYLQWFWFLASCFTEIFLTRGVRTVSYGSSVHVPPYSPSYLTGRKATAEHNACSYSRLRRLHNISLMLMCMLAANLPCRGPGAYRYKVFEHAKKYYGLYYDA